MSHRHIGVAGGCEDCCTTGILPTLGPIASTHYRVLRGPCGQMFGHSGWEIESRPSCSTEASRHPRTLHRGGVVQEITPKSMFSPGPLFFKPRYRLSNLLRPCPAWGQVLVSVCP